MAEDPPLSFECTDKVLIQTAVITPDRADLPLLDVFASAPTTSTDDELTIGNHKIGVAYLAAADPVDTVDTSADDEKPPGLLAKTMHRLRRASWRHSGRH